MINKIKTIYYKFKYRKQLKKIKKYNKYTY